MCLYVDKEANKKFLDEFSKNETVEVWKQYDVKYDFDIKKHFLSPPYFYNRKLRIYKHGTIKSNRWPKWLGFLNWHDKRFFYKTIHRGIHVYLKKQKSHKSVTFVKVTAKVKDFVGADEFGCAVFTKIYIPKEEFDKAIKDAIDNHRIR